MLARKVPWPHTTGWYDLGMDDLEPQDQTLTYQFDYWQQPKRGSL